MAAGSAASRTAVLPKGPGRDLATYRDYCGPGLYCVQPGVETGRTLAWTTAPGELNSVGDIDRSGSAAHLKEESPCSHQHTANG